MTDATAFPITTATDGPLKVIEGIELRGRVNLPDEKIMANIRYAIRQQHPQVKVQELQKDRVALVCSGPSLNDTVDELVALLREGAKLVTVNGAYRWCLDRNLTPSAQIVMDARPENVRFLDPAIPKCAYLLASQVDPSLWDAVKDREHVWVFHAMNPDNPEKAIFDAYYRGNWHGVGGGTTVMTRSIGLLRMLGYVTFDIFGADSCWRGSEHHAFEQPENDRDRRSIVRVELKDHPELTRKFLCSPWHVKQFEDALQLIRINGDQFLLNFHGNGLLAWAMKTLALGAEFAVEPESNDAA